jgi:hypothetical protein
MQTNGAFREIPLEIYRVQVVGIPRNALGLSYGVTFPQNGTLGSDAYWLLGGGVGPDGCQGRRTKLAEPGYNL